MIHYRAVGGFALWFSHTHILLHTHSARYLSKLGLMFRVAWINFVRHCVLTFDTYVRVIHSFIHSVNWRCNFSSFCIFHVLDSNRMKRSELISRQNELLEIFFFKYLFEAIQWNHFDKTQARNFCEKWWEANRCEVIRCLHHFSA